MSIQPNPPGARNENSPLEKAYRRVYTVRAWTCISGDGVLGARWADSQRSIAGLSAVLEESRQPSAILPFFPFPPFPILMQEELEKRAQDRTDGVREDRYILVRTVHARSLQCKAASKKNTWKRLSPPVAPFNAIRQAVEPTRARVWHKICKFYLSGKLHCQSSPVASTKLPDGIRTGALPYPYRARYAQHDR